MFKVKFDVFRLDDGYFMVVDKRVVLEVVSDLSGDYVDYVCTLPTGIRFQDWMCRKLNSKMVDVEDLIQKGDETGFSTEDIMNVLGYGIPNALPEKGKECHVSSQILPTEAKKEETQKRENGL
jgi:hypothetical protein